MLGTLASDQIDQVLSSNVTGHIECTDGAKVYVVPVNYVFNGSYLIAHSEEGIKTDMMREHPHICFQVDETAGDDNWRSVLVKGDYEEITDPKERYYAMKSLVSHLMHIKHETVCGQVSVYRIRILEKTGRFEKD